MGKKVAIIIAVVVAVLMVAACAVFMIFGNKNSTNTPSADSNSGQQNNVNGGNTDNADNTNNTDNNSGINNNNQQDLFDQTEQDVMGGSITVCDIGSNYDITVNSQYFTDTRDTVDIQSGTLTSSGKALVTEVMKFENAYVSLLDSNFNSSDTVIITAHKPQTERARYSLNGNNVELNVDSIAQSVEMTIDNGHIKIKGFKESFSCRIMKMGEGSSRDITINGFTNSQKSDVEISYENGSYIVMSTEKLNGLYVSAYGYNNADPYSSTSENVYEQSYKYQISIANDGTVTISAID